MLRTSLSVYNCIISLVIDDVNLKLYERKCEPIDGALNFTFKVRYRGQYVQELTPMNALEQKGEIVNGD